MSIYHIADHHFKSIFVYYFMYFYFWKQYFAEINLVRRKWLFISICTLHNNVSIIINSPSYVFNTGIKRAPALKTPVNKMDYYSKIRVCVLLYLVLKNNYNVKTCWRGVAPYCCIIVIVDVHTYFIGIFCYTWLEKVFIIYIMVDAVIFLQKVT